MTQAKTQTQTHYIIVRQVKENEYRVCHFGQWSNNSVLPTRREIEEQLQYFQAIHPTERYEVWECGPPRQSELF